MHNKNYKISSEKIENIQSNSSTTLMNFRIEVHKVSRVKSGVAARFYRTANRCCRALLTH